VTTAPSSSETNPTSELSLQPVRNPKAIGSLILGITTLVLIPILSFLFAPCGFPTALLAGILAITLGGKAKKENPEDKIARVGVITAWIGIVLNTLIMFLKLAMFVIIFILPVLALIQAGKMK
jgi:hypothetical protein